MTTIGKIHNVAVAFLLVLTIFEVKGRSQDLFLAREHSYNYGCPSLQECRENLQCALNDAKQIQNEHRKISDLLHENQGGFRLSKFHKSDLQKSANNIQANVCSIKSTLQSCSSKFMKVSSFIGNLEREIHQLKLDKSTWNSESCKTSSSQISGLKAKCVLFQNELTSIQSEKMRLHHALNTLEHENKQLKQELLNCKENTKKDPIRNATCNCPTVPCDDETRDNLVSKIKQLEENILYLTTKIDMLDLKNEKLSSERNRLLGIMKEVLGVSPMDGELTGGGNTIVIPPLDTMSCNCTELTENINQLKNKMNEITLDYKHTEQLEINNKIMIEEIQTKNLGMESLKNQLQRRELDIVDLQKLLKVKDSTISELTSKVEEFSCSNSKLEKCEHENSLLSYDITQLEDALIKSESENSNLHSEVLELTNALAQQEVKLLHLQESNNQLDEKIETDNYEITDLNLDHGVCKEKLGQLTKYLSSLQEQIKWESNVHENKLLQHITENHNLKAEIHGLQAQVDKLKSKCTTPLMELEILRNNVTGITYYIEKENQRNYFGAWDFCRLHGMMPLHIKNEDEQLFIASKLMDLAPGALVSTSMNTLNEHRLLVSSSTGTVPTYEHWQDDKRPNEEDSYCVVLENTDDGKFWWKAVDCMNTSAYFVCQNNEPCVSLSKYFDCECNLQPVNQGQQSSNATTLQQR